MKYRETTKNSVRVISDEADKIEAINRAAYRLKDYEMRITNSFATAAEFFVDSVNPNERRMQITEILKTLKEEGF